MSDPLLSIVVPTIDGRETWLERCEQAYCETTDDFEFIVVRNEPTCNGAWNVGIPQASGDYIHLSADDIEPLDGWWEAAIAWVDKGFLPAPRILNPDFSLQSCGDTDQETSTGSPTTLTRVPFFSREQMERARLWPVMEGHYCGDVWITHQAKMAGIPTVVVREMQFIHSFSPVGRLDHRLEEDCGRFKQIERRDLRRRR